MTSERATGETAISDDEVDAFSKSGRKFFNFKAGGKKAAKAAFNRRVRRKAAGNLPPCRFVDWNNGAAGKD